MLLTAVWCAGVVVYVATQSTAYLPAALPGYLELALALSLPVALAAAMGWWTATGRSPLVSARGGGLRGGGAALLSALYLLMTIPLIAVGFALLTFPLTPPSDPPHLVGPLTVAVYLFASPLGWVELPVTAAVGALYGSVVHRTIGSPNARLRALPPDDVLAP